MNKIRLGFALCGSFCTFRQNIELMKGFIAKDFDIVPIMSFNASGIDTRFGKASEIIAEIETLCGKKVIRTIEDAEPIGPTSMTDIMLVSPCTGNTLAKLSHSITDSPVTMAVKSHLRNNNPVVIAVSTNDGLSGSAKNIGTLQNLRNYYFVPMGQDNSTLKPASLVAHFDKAYLAVEFALKGIQLEPMLTTAI